jgi:hypothetical protein
MSDNMISIGELANRIVARMALDQTKPAKGSSAELIKLVEDQRNGLWEFRA